MHLEHAILGFLNYQPWTGYELKRIFDMSIRHFWPADQSQIYKTLARLADQGLAEAEIVPQEGRPNRKVYHITDAGREAFQEAQRQPAAEAEIREPFLIHVFFGGFLNDDQVIAQLEAKAEELRAHRDQLLELSAQPLHGEGGQAPARDRFFWFLTLDCGLWDAQASLDWVEETIERIRNKDYTSGETGAVLPPPRRKR